MRLELDTIRTVAGYCKKKPSRYHHKCSGMLDELSISGTIECWRKGRINRRTLKCETCDGQHKEDLLLLTDSEESYNRGIDRLLAVLEGDV